MDFVAGEIKERDASLEGLQVGGEVDSSLNNAQLPADVIAVLVHRFLGET